LHWIYCRKIEIYVSGSKSSNPLGLGILLINSFYSFLPPKRPEFLTNRTFTILPPMTHPTYSQWRAQTNTIAPDEVQAHMGMFSPKTNDGFYDLGLEVVHAIAERIEEEGVGRAVGKEDAEVGFQAGEKSLEDGFEGGKGGWREEKDEKGRSIWVEV
jgi:hypothetical protein